MYEELKNVFKQYFAVVKVSPNKGIMFTIFIEGSEVGTKVGQTEGMAVGTQEGKFVGTKVGQNVGTKLGPKVGA